MTRFALYTTIYPAMAPFLEDWCKSVNAQDCRNFDVWIGVDGIEIERVSSLLDEHYTITFVAAVAGDTPISLRCRAIEQMVANYDAIVFVDSDDLLEPSRVSEGLVGISNADVLGCALGLIDISGQDLGGYFGLLEGENPEDVLPRHNFLGLSNTVWKCDILRKCLPVPKYCVAMDWLLATRAWGHGAKILFDRTIRMKYRQYGGNTAQVVPPFLPEKVFKATALVQEHYRILTADQEEFPAEKRQQLENAAERVEIFNQTTLAFSDRLASYIDALNHLPPHRFWWMSVAHPDLEELWNC